MTSIYSRLKPLLLATVVACFSAVAQAQVPAYIAGTWSDSSVHFLDINLNDLSSFATGLGTNQPNGIATDGSLIYTGHFTTQEVVAYNYAGVEQFRWSASPINNMQGMEMVGPNLAIYNFGFTVEIQYRDPATGALLGTIPAQPSVEGLAYDGSVLWQLNDSVIYATDPTTGTVLGTIPNPAASSPFGGTGLASSGPNELTVAAQTGDWWKISSLTGAIQSSGNNGLDMYALKTTGVPEPGSLALICCMGVCGVAAVALRSGTAN